MSSSIRMKGAAELPCLPPLNQIKSMSFPTFPAMASLHRAGREGRGDWQEGVGEGGRGSPRALYTLVGCSLLDVHGQWISIYFNKVFLAYCNSRALEGQVSPAARQGGPCKLDETQNQIKANSAGDPQHRNILVKQGCPTTRTIQPRSVVRLYILSLWSNHLRVHL